MLEKASKTKNGVTVMIPRSSIPFFQLFSSDFCLFNCNLFTRIALGKDLLVVLHVFFILRLASYLDLNSLDLRPLE